MMNRSRWFTADAKDVRNYSSRGIVVCERWLDFRKFLEDMGDRPGEEYSLDRYPNNNGNYEPGNCRWATAGEQARNRRVSLYVDYRGQRYYLKDLCEEVGLPYSVVLGRMYIGWSLERALREPVGARRGPGGAGRIVEYRGREVVFSELREEFGDLYEVVRNRINLGWSVDRAVSEPVRRRGPNKKPKAPKVKVVRATSEWEKIKQAADGRCHYCRRKTKRLTKDHVIPLSKGGLDVASNIVPACLRCNLSKGSKIVTLL
jgi:hypothetical protein